MNLLLIGSDSRGDSYNYGLADMIRLARVDFVNARVTILEFPRDMWVEIPDVVDNLNGQDHEKLNQAYLYGNPGFHYTDDPAQGPGLLARTLALNFGAQIDHYAAVNMRTFVNIVNAVGGLDVYLPDAVDGRTPDDMSKRLCEPRHHPQSEPAVVQGLPPSVDGGLLATEPSQPRVVFRRLDDDTGGAVEAQLPRLDGRAPALRPQRRPRHDGRRCRLHLVALWLRHDPRARAAGRGRVPPARGAAPRHVEWATMVGLGDRLGKVRLGYIADLLVVNGNPLESLRVLNPYGVDVLKDGRMTRGGGIELTIKNGIPYHVPTLMKEVKGMVDADRKKLDSRSIQSLNEGAFVVRPLAFENAVMPECCDAAMTAQSLTFSRVGRRVIRSLRAGGPLVPRPDRSSSG